MLNSENLYLLPFFRDSFVTLNACIHISITIMSRNIINVDMHNSEHVMSERVRGVGPETGVGKGILSIGLP